MGDETAEPRQRLERIERKIDHFYTQFCSLAALGSAYLVGEWVDHSHLPLKNFMAAVAFYATFIAARWILRYGWDWEWTGE
jgi:hypothetical protein